MISKKVTDALQKMKLAEVKDKMQKIAEALDKDQILCFACLADCSKDFHAVQMDKGKKAAFCPDCYKELGRQINLMDKQKRQ